MAFLRIPLQPVLFAVAACMSATPAHACYSPPGEQLITVDEQIALATDVSLARVASETRLDGGLLRYEFKVLRRLAGPARARFSLTVRPVAPADRSSSDDHSDEAFWAYGGGRPSNDASCLIRPTFVVGKAYLAFLGDAVTRRSFEHIEDAYLEPGNRDKWLQYVEERLAKRQASPSQPERRDFSASP